MTAKQAATALGVNERTVRRAIKEGRLSATKTAGAFDVDLEQARLVVGRGPARYAATYQAALADALQLLRAFGHEGDAQAVERQHGLVFVEPKPEVYLA